MRIEVGAMNASIPHHPPGKHVTAPTHLSVSLRRRTNLSGRDLW